jgi:phosphoenolpyruvate-protein kinase (PTS system EI component)
VPDQGSRLTGLAGADGIVVGPVHRLADDEIPAGGEGGPAEQERARAALQAVAARLGEASECLRATERSEEAEILEASQLMAEDPSLLAEVEALAASRPAAAALLEATERQADLLAAIPDPYLAARAADVRRLGRQAARLALAPRPPHHASLGVHRTPALRAHGAPLFGPPYGPTMREGETDGLPSAPVAGSGAGSEGGPVILIARDLGPADLAEVELSGIALGGIALAEGSVTSHAAISARALGIPLVVGLGERVLELDDRVVVVLDGVAGVLVTSPTQQTLQQARVASARQDERRALLAHSRAGGAVTADGRRIRLLVNASTEREVLAGLAAGADGVGLLRTELAFLEVLDWPAAAQHESAVRPVLRHLGGRVATVRTLDFGADKMPPFLRGRTERGIALQLAASGSGGGASLSDEPACDAADGPGAFEAQVRALLLAGAASGADLRIMLPLVECAEQVDTARRLLVATHQAVGGDAPVPPLGAMIETRAAVEQIEAIAATADFLSIGTNDLVQDLLGLDRLTPAATVRSAADPRVLRAIGTVTAAARRHNLSVEVCGEAAGDPRLAVLLIGLGVSELSAAPSRLDEVRVAVRAVTLTRASQLAELALTSDSATPVLALLDDELAERGTVPSGC